jgi:hypothetical protein
MKILSANLVCFAATLLCLAPAQSFSLDGLSEKELRTYALNTSKGCISNSVIDEGAGPAEYCSMTIDYILEIMKRRGWTYRRYYR